MSIELSYWFTVNDVTSDGEAPYESLCPLKVGGPEQTLMQACRTAFEQGGERWKLDGYKPDEAGLEGRILTRWFGFTDDFQVWLQACDQSSTWLILTRSSSRLGKGDLGQNARNIRSYQERLEPHIKSDEELDWLGTTSKIDS